ncbi:MAG: DNA polymerase III subunit delta' [Candidatus Berkelbacteria bacterium Licking1014_7]|uniref:DNA polymerase III subunit delta n=1 Tax=Candidatus Berkelbacteria bacterium Licking1014_7 TaxID=2017147 RepID=A0A554LK03_9BACT|nr:MAG: DNA polymerase III subunit delta' [Candidatus Berkelbacteria bacterium Licking1014_7]
MANLSNLLQYATFGYKMLIVRHRPPWRMLPHVSYFSLKCDHISLRLRVLQWVLWENSNMLNFLREEIYSYLLIGDEKNIFENLIQALRQKGVKQYQILDILDREKSIITIGCVRKLRKQISQKPFDQKDVWYLLMRASWLKHPGGIATQNSLLKIIEEPPKFLKILIVCQDPRLILPTIVSRCARVRIANVGQTAISVGEKNIDLRDLANKKYFEIFQFSQKFATDENLAEKIDNWIKEFGKGLTKESGRVMTKKRQRILKALLKAKEHLVETNVNRRLLLDNLFLKIKESDRLRSVQ